jgi:hypothetical protein
MNTDISNIITKLQNLTPKQYVELASSVFPEIQWTFRVPEEYSEYPVYPWEVTITGKYNSKTPYELQLNLKEISIDLYEGFKLIPLTFQQTAAIVIYLMALENNNK